ncbi:hypothetical protein T492DRAFT_238198 [Pavlovales sp. CCMP2436]|nr:hypothetical protein T492DRAFT_238198 [Pavlovales sp. CCMP2436]
MNGFPKVQARLWVRAVVDRVCRVRHTRSYFFKKSDTSMVRSSPWPTERVGAAGRERPPGDAQRLLQLLELLCFVGSTTSSGKTAREQGGGRRAEWHRVRQPAHRQRLHDRARAGESALGGRAGDVLAGEVSATTCSRTSISSAPQRPSARSASSPRAREF